MHRFLVSALLLWLRTSSPCWTATQFEWALFFGTCVEHGQLQTLGDETGPSMQHYLARAKCSMLSSLQRPGKHRVCYTCGRGSARTERRHENSTEGRYDSSKRYGQ